MLKPGEGIDKNGVPIYPGDLLRSFHFRAARRRKVHYLYHTAVYNDQSDCMEMVPVSHLEPTKRKGGGQCWLSQELAQCSEIIQGHGPGDCICYDDRPKVRREHCDLCGGEDPGCGRTDNERLLDSQTGMTADERDHLG